MYADRYGSKKLNPGSLALSVGIVGGLVAAAMMSNTVVTALTGEKPPLTIYPVPPETPPPPPDPQPRRQPKAPIERQVLPQLPQVPDLPRAPFVPPPDPGPPVGLGGDGGTGIVIDPPKPPPPVLRGADVDGRYARDFQPTYPVEERRAGREGVVTLRVLIGVDGRVREVERVAAASDAFWRVTERQALGRWRFRPATRDGVPYDSWKQMTVRFTLEDGE